MYQIDIPCEVDRAMAEVYRTCSVYGRIKATNEQFHTMTVKFKPRGFMNGVTFEIALAERGDVTRMIASGSQFASFDPEKPGDLYEKHFDRVVAALAETFGLTDLKFPGTLVRAEALGDGVGTQSVSYGKNVSLGRAAVGGALFGGAGAVVGGLSGTKTTRTFTYEDFTGSIPFRLYYSNGRVIEKVIAKSSKEFPAMLALSMKTEG